MNSNQDSGIHSLKGNIKTLCKEVTLKKIGRSYHMLTQVVLTDLIIL